MVRENGGHAVAMHYSMETVYGMKPGEVFWAASDIGWVVVTRTLHMRAHLSLCHRTLRRQTH